MRRATGAGAEPDGVRSPARGVFQPGPAGAARRVAGDQAVRQPLGKLGGLRETETVAPGAVGTEPDADAALVMSVAGATAVFHALATGL